MPSLKLFFWGLAVAACVTHAQDVVAEGTRLVKYTGCSKQQENQIYEAWFDALKLAKAAKGNFKWDEEAEVDFFGPPALNQPEQKNIQGICLFPCMANTLTDQSKSHRRECCHV
jgi:hypothetical protein